MVHCGNGPGTTQCTTAGTPLSVTTAGNTTVRHHCRSHHSRYRHSKPLPVPTQQTTPGTDSAGHHCKLQLRHGRTPLHLRHGRTPNSANLSKMSRNSANFSKMSRNSANSAKPTPLKQQIRHRYHTSVAYSLGVLEV